MSFDPTFDYGKTELSLGLNQTYRNFSELLKVLITLSSEADKQIEIIGYGAVCDEMAIDFEMYYTHCYKSYLSAELINIEQKAILDDIDKSLDVQSGDNNPDFWDDFQLEFNREWQIIRDKAKNALKILGFDDLEIELDRQEEFDKKGQLVMQSTMTMLVRK